MDIVQGLKVSTAVLDGDGEVARYDIAISQSLKLINCLDITSWTHSIVLVGKEESDSRGKGERNALINQSVIRFIATTHLFCPNACESAGAQEQPVSNLDNQAEHTVVGISQRPQYSPPSAESIHYMEGLHKSE